MSNQSFETGNCAQVVYSDGTEWPCERMGCAFAAREWYGGQWSALYRLGCGGFSPANVTDAAAELERAVNHPDSEPDDDAYFAVEELNEWAAKVAHLVEEEE